MTKLVTVHMTRPLIEEFEKYQGGKRRMHGMREPVLDGVHELFTHPRMIEVIKSESIKRNAGGRCYSRGGNVRAAAIKRKALRMKHAGRYGDTEMALITPATAAALDHYIGGRSNNPKTGHREYFLGALFGALAPALVGGLGGGIASAASGGNFFEGMGKGLTGQPIGQPGMYPGMQPGYGGVPVDPYAQAQNWLANKPKGIVSMGGGMGYQDPQTQGQLGAFPKAL